jgi:hypothetical protein
MYVYDIALSVLALHCPTVYVCISKISFKAASISCYTGEINISLCKMIVRKTDISVDCNPECVIHWFYIRSGGGKIYECNFPISPRIREEVKGFVIHFPYMLLCETV